MMLFKAENGYNSCRGQKITLETSKKYHTEFKIVPARSPLRLLMFVTFIQSVRSHHFSGCTKIKGRTQCTARTVPCVCHVSEGPLCCFLCACISAAPIVWCSLKSHSEQLKISKIIKRILKNTLLFNLILEPPKFYLRSNLSFNHPRINQWELLSSYLSCR